MVSFPMKGALCVKWERCGRSGFPIRGREDKRERGTSPFTVTEIDWGWKTGLAMKGRIKVGNGKREVGSFPLGGDGEDVCHLEQICH